MYVKDAIKIYVYNTFPLFNVAFFTSYSYRFENEYKGICGCMFVFFIDICLILSQCVKRLSSFLVYFQSIFYEIVSVCRFHLLPFPLQRISNTYKEAFKNPENMFFSRCKTKYLLLVSLFDISLHLFLWENMYVCV